MNRIKRALTSGDISTMVLVGGVGLLMWAAIGMFIYPSDLAHYAAMFNVGKINYWVLNHLIVGALMLALVADGFPKRMSLFVGSWLIVAWAWAVLFREVTDLTQQNGKASAIMYIVIGIFIIHRASMK